MSDIEKRDVGYDAKNDLERSSSIGDASSAVLEHGAIQRAAISAAYEAKSHLINECMQNEIGFGAYQIQVFILTGLGWMADNIWLQGVAIVLPQVQQEMNPSHVEYTTLALYVGLILGASCWGVLADLIGRRLSFNITLFIAGVFGIAAGAPTNFTALGALVACVGFGVGGNLPVDGAIFLETVPQSHQWLLTLLSAWWALGQLFASLIAWAFIGNFSCDDSIAAGECPKADNMGWRYTFYTLGAVTFAMFIFRFILFDLQESAKYLVAKGRHAEAIEVLHHIARKNGKAITLTVEHFDAIGGQREASNLTKMETIRKSLTGLSLSHVRPLFATRRLAINTTITVLLWGIIGLAYPLFNGFITLYLKARVPAGSSSVGTTYRNYTIISVLGIPGSILACLVVDWTRKDKSRFALGGRKLAMTITTALTGVFLFLFTTAKGEDAVLGYNCASALTTNAMYGVLYAYTPEVFPAPHRGTGDAIASAFNRITGLLAPIIKIATTSGGATTSAANG
ncbi:major facilitator superfamily domain-containing protein [Amylostereum chailletii]|nr:major facilitator superfamily domain-containing protein [Amylostereum chailletii]